MKTDMYVGYRLSFNEIVYLAARTEAKEIYGLKHEPKEYDEESLAKDWEAVKESLMAKGFLIQHSDNDMLTLDGNLYELVEIMCKPQLFFVCQTRDDIKSRRCNYYLSNNVAVKLEYEETNKELYSLVRYDDSQALRQSIQTFLEVKTKKFEIIDEKIIFGIDELTNFINSIIDNDTELQEQILRMKGVKEENLFDIAEALAKKSCLRTMLVISFKGGSAGIVKEYIIYGGEKYLWQIELRDNKAKITSINNDVIQKKVEVLAEVLYYV